MTSIEHLKHLHIPLEDISVVTNRFAEENRIAKGGFGKVYKGISEKHGAVAIKRLVHDGQTQGQGDHEFKTEIILLSKYKHDNIVSLYGYCDEDGEKILVYKYESNGSLDKHLNSPTLTWIQRLRICLDAAKGLMYLHDDIEPHERILHRDVKSANILLDDKWKAKISDFGLSRLGPANRQSTFLISNACGTFGYIDPEYLIQGYLTQKSDVYSFGIVLFEVLCGRPAQVIAYKDERQFLVVWVKKHYNRHTLDKIILPDLQNQIDTTSLSTFSDVAYQCLRDGDERPTMKKVVEQLQKALDYQLASSGSRADNQSSCGREDTHKTVLDFNILPQSTTVTLKIPLHCDGCIQKIKRIISKFNGVELIKVDGKKDLVTVKGTMNMKKFVPYLKDKLKRNVDIVPPKKEDYKDDEKKDEKKVERGDVKKGKEGDYKKNDAGKAVGNSERGVTGNDERKASNDKAKATCSDGDESKNVGATNKFEYYGLNSYTSTMPVDNQTYYNQDYAVPIFANHGYGNYQAYNINGHVMLYPHGPTPPMSHNNLRASESSIYGAENPNACSIM